MSAARMAFAVSGVKTVFAPNVYVSVAPNVVYGSAAELGPGVTDMLLWRAINEHGAGLDILLQSGATRPPPNAS